MLHLIFRLLILILLPNLILSCTSIKKNNSSLFDRSLTSDNNLAQTCKNLEIRDSDINQFKTDIQNRVHSPLQTKNTISKEILVFEEMIKDPSTNTEKCIHLQSIKLSEMILADILNYQEWLVFLSKRIEKKFNFASSASRTNYHINFLRIFEQYWFFNIMEIIEQTQFEKDWDSLKFNLRAFTAIFSAAGAVLKLPRSIILKLLRSPQIRTAIIRRVTPLTVLSTANDSKNKIHEKLNALNDKELAKILRSPITIFEQSTRYPLSDYNITTNNELEKLNLKNAAQGLQIKIGSLSGGISVGLFADLAVSKSGIIPFLKSKSLTFDKILEEKNSKRKKRKLKKKRQLSNKN